MLPKLKDRLRRGDVLVGTFVKFPSVASVEILGEIGYDFAIFDLEHSALDFETAEPLMNAADAVRMGIVIRVPDKQEHLITKSLDLGCDGVQIPMIATEEDAVRSVSAARYHPFGQRSISFTTRAARYTCMDTREYIRSTNANQLVIAQIETGKGVENAESIAAVEGVDVLFVGPADLSQSLGFPGQSSHPGVLEGIRTVGLAAKKNGKILGTHVKKATDTKQMLNYGVTYFVFGTDITFFVAGARGSLKSVKAIIGSG